MNLFFIGSNVQEYKILSEVQKKQYFGVGYTFMLSKLKESLDPHNVFVRNAF